VADRVFFWVIRRNEFDQRRLKHRLPHLFEEHLFVRLLDVQIALARGKRIPC
jgi:hypothetical protein